MTSEQRELLKQGWGGGYFLTDTRPIYCWAADNILLPQMYVEHGRFSVDTSRYMIRAFDAIQDRRVREVDILKAVQTGGTLVSEISTLWFLVNQPGPIMWTFHNDSTAKKHCKSRWNPLMASLPQLKPSLDRLDRHSKNIQEIYFGPYFIIVNAANIGSLQSISIRYKINDEVWNWDPGMMKEAKGRISAYEERGTSKFINISQAGKAKRDWQDQFNRGTKEYWGFRCECNKPVALLRQHGEKENRAGLVWDFDAKDEDGYWNVARCAETAHYQCPHCGKRWEDSDHTRGLWNKSGEYMAPREDADSRHVSLSWNALARRSMAALVNELTEAENLKRKGVIIPLEECLQKRFSEFTSEETFAEVIEIQLGGYSMNDYFDGDVKLDGEVRRFMSVDRQQNRYYALVRAYRADGSSRMLWATQTQTVEQVREVQERMNIPDWHVGLDSSYQTEDCYRICAKYKWVALEGSEHTQDWRHGDRTRRFYSPYQQNKTDEGVCVRHLFGGERIKDMVARWREAPDQWEAPADPPEEYEEAISSSEAKKETINKRTGRPQWKWVTIKKRVNHYWDCEVMNTALAMIHGVIGSVSKKLPAKKKAEKVVTEAGNKDNFTTTKPAKAPARRPMKRKSFATNW